MLKISPFEKYTDQYDAWFDEHRAVYEAELRAIKEMIPAGKSGLEIGTAQGVSRRLWVSGTASSRQDA